MTDGKFDFDGSVLRDDLAADRTVMANERTLLAYIRTALFLLVSGISALKVFPESLWMIISGITLVLLAVVVMGFGVHRFRHIKRKIEALKGKTEGQGERG